MEWNKIVSIMFVLVLLYPTYARRTEAEQMVAKDMEARGM